MVNFKEAEEGSILTSFFCKWHISNVEISTVIDFSSVRLYLFHFKKTPKHLNNKTTQTNQPKTNSHTQKKGFLGPSSVG